MKTWFRGRAMFVVLVLVGALAASGSPASGCERCKYYLTCIVDECFFDSFCAPVTNFGAISWAYCTDGPGYCSESGDLCRWASLSPAAVRPDFVAQLSRISELPAWARPRAAR